MTKYLLLKIRYTDLHNDNKEKQIVLLNMKFVKTIL